MPAPSVFPFSRRQFLGGCCAAVTGTGMLSALAQLRMLGAVATPGPAVPGIATAGSDYKALVCIFLAGGNDGNNVIVPSDSAGYASYATARGELALAQESLLGLTPKTTDGRAWGFHPAMTSLRDLFAQGKLAVLANVGTLAVPTTKLQYFHGAVPLPFQLFAHNDQQVEWQSGVVSNAVGTGWGGRLADLTNALNTNNTISMSVSLAGRNVFQVGRTTAQYAINSSGSVTLTGATADPRTGDGVRAAALRDVLSSPSNNLFQAAFGDTTTEAANDSAILAGLLGDNTPLKTQFPTSSLGAQLRTIARLIAVREQLGLKRQIFFARNGGWDLHGAQLSAQNGLLADLSRSLAAFYNATEELGVANQVTSFTASDFGRTYNSNGDGTDHGWGGHQFILGGAVKGGDIYGKMPTLTINGPDDTGRGRWLPTTSVDEYNARLALWFGVSPTDLPVVLPNIGRFNYARDELAFI